MPRFDFRRLDLRNGRTSPVLRLRQIGEGGARSEDDRADYLALREPFVPNLLNECS